MKTLWDPNRMHRKEQSVDHRYDYGQPDEPHTSRLTSMATSILTECRPRDREPRPVDLNWLRLRLYRPWKSGSRFSTNALAASLWSSVKPV